MIRFVALAFFFLLAFGCLSQIRLDKLVLEPKQKFVIENTDILVVDTLIMKDSSSIFLNLSKQNNFIHAKQVVVGKGCSILGNGKNGEKGKPGEPGARQPAPCRSGSSGAGASNGFSGEHGVDLSLYMNSLKINGSILINLNGGDGGDGGKGGDGGDGGSGTRVCPAGDGGKGGNGAHGGGGGQGGSLVIKCKTCEDLHLIMGNKLTVKNFGGFGGLGGDGGAGGHAGLGPLRDGTNGPRGVNGKSAPQGKTGGVNLGRE
ncbi:hypothetical protein WSM22_15430 [Cytophagales bacterium WSM2-2]|nr:hypothetical protein WSM22_15430 [Cytophagales bacterium WSM2-2]